MSIGLPLDGANVLSLPPSIVVYGAPGGGKSTEVARALQGVLYVQSSPTILRAYADWLQKNPQYKLKMPDRVTLDETTVAKNFGGSVTTALVTVMEKYIAACDAGTCPYTGIVFDEWNVLCERMFAELKTDPWGKFKGRSGSLNIFAVFDAFKGIHRSVLSIARRTRRSVAFVAHYQSPKVDDDENSPTRGSIKWPGGPKMPMGLSDQVVELCADADVVLQLVIKDEKAGTVALPIGDAAPVGPPPSNAPRVFLTQLDPKWFRKVRGWGVEKEEPLDIHAGKGLKELLTRAGYQL